MIQRDPVTVDKFYQQNQAALGLQLVAGAAGLGRLIREATVNRPGLALAGFTKYFAKHRVQVIGNAESHFLKSLSPGRRARRCQDLLSHRIPCLVFCRNYNPEPALLAAADKARVPVFKSPLVTMNFINQATLKLESMFAPHDTELGSMVDILGIGVILRGESGIGKSECVLALIERGYSLVSDDVTRVTLAGGHEVLGASPAQTRNHMEVRGIGIINIPAMFGIRSIRTNKRVDLVVTLRAWDEVDNVDRVGIDEDQVTILGVALPHMTIPVRPGRDIARLIEVAAFHTKLKMTGYNPAKEFNDRLIARMQRGQSL
jgi:HPr kinase/phosphorylase